MLDLPQPDWIDAMSATVLATVAALGMLGGILGWLARRRQQRHPPDIDLRHEPDATAFREDRHAAIAVLFRNRATLPVTLLRVEAAVPAGGGIVDWRRLPEGDGAPPLMLPNAAPPRPPRPPLVVQPGASATLVAVLAPVAPPTAEIDLRLTVRFDRGLPRVRAYQRRATLDR